MPRPKAALIRSTSPRTCQSGYGDVSESVDDVKTCYSVKVSFGDITRSFSKFDVRRERALETVLRYSLEPILASSTLELLS